MLKYVLFSFLAMVFLAVIGRSVEIGLRKPNLFICEMKLKKEDILLSKVSGMFTSVF